MKKTHSLTVLLSYSLMSFFAHAETNALIEVKLFKDWIIEGERIFCNVAIKNTGTSPIRLFEDAVAFHAGQIAIRVPNKSNNAMEPGVNWLYDSYAPEYPFFKLLSGETHVYEGRRFSLSNSFSGEKFVVSVYLNNGFWLDSEPMTINRAISDSEEFLATINDGRNLQNNWELVAITYKNERWLYKRLHQGGLGAAVCPLSLSNKIRVEPHDGKGRYKIWDGDKSMIYEIGSGLLLEGPDENNVFGKWTRERKQKAEADNAEVRRRKAEERR